MMKPHFVMLADYNRWANERLYEAADKMSEADYRRDLGAFFGSLHGTLNHILVADRIWMARFTGSAVPTSKLDAILYDQRPALAAARREEDERIIAYVEALDESEFDGIISYRTISNPVAVRQPLAPALAHFFNHQTHHRGQAHALITMGGGRDAAPSLDLILFQRETGIGLG